jgi:hypothetical protein
LLPGTVRGLHWWEHVAVLDEVTGELVGFYLIDTPEDAPHDVRKGLTRRRLALLHGRCQCGSELVWPDRADRAEGPSVHHRTTCPGHIDVLAAAIAEWEGR